MKPTSILPPNIVRLMSKEDQERLGQVTVEVVAQLNEAVDEKELHEQISSLLRRRDIVYVHASMFKRSTLPVGYPDFSFVYHGEAYGWELKVGKNKLSPEQVEMLYRMNQNGWDTVVINSTDQALRILKEIEARHA
jgi:hypothetical protein